MKKQTKFTHEFSATTQDYWFRADFWSWELRKHNSRSSPSFGDIRGFARTKKACRIEAVKVARALKMRVQWETA